MRPAIVLILRGFTTFGFVCLEPFAEPPSSAALSASAWLLLSRRISSRSQGMKEGRGRKEEEKKRTDSETDNGSFEVTAAPSWTSFFSDILAATVSRSPFLALAAGGVCCCCRSCCSCSWCCCRGKKRTEMESKSKRSHKQEGDLVPVSRRLLSVLLLITTSSQRLKTMWCRSPSLHLGQRDLM